ncbi:MAG TPA: PP2C family protein-serine/threonine phosphatase [Candidatus Polarisedimenticolia bacterium]|nr:PP2C family protein-serine/threonine phosphatase [Candidatus Polarisedimenticolia bacterium]
MLSSVAAGGSAGRAPTTISKSTWRPTLPAASGYSWRQIPRWSAALFFLGVFCLFSTIGFISDITEMGRQPVPRLVLSVLLSGGFAMLYAGFGVVLRSRAWMALVPLFTLQFFLQYLIKRSFPGLAQQAELGPADVARLEHRLSITAIFIILAVVGGYVSFLTFSITEGRRYFRVHAEMQLAQEIHRVLVPPIAARHSGYEFHGHSEPSGEVGGDLIDVVAGESGWVAYIADVSGHGVAPGVVMGMAKSAARMHLTSGGALSDLLPRLHAVIQPLMKPNMFVTVACLGSTPSGLRYALAGHPPILHYQAGKRDFSELTCRSLPVGLLPDTSFQTAAAEDAPGDLFVFVTDGVLEATNGAGEEFGVAGIKAVIAQNPELPLDQLKDALVGAARRHGPIADDLSVLLVRRDR